MKDYRFSNNTAKRRYELDLEDGQIAMIEYYLAPGGEMALAARRCLTTTRARASGAR